MMALSEAAHPGVLIVDDHALVRAALRALVGRVCPTAHVSEAGAAGDALERLANQRPAVIIVDVHLPGLSGIDLVRRIRRADRTQRILMLTADTDPWTVAAALEAGAKGFVQKASPPEVIEAAVRAVLAGKTYLCEASCAALGLADHCASIGDDHMPGPAVLTEREREVLRYLAHGEHTKAIAAALGISAKTVETHRQHITSKLGTSNVAALVRYAIRHGLTRP